MKYKFNLCQQGQVLPETGETSHKDFTTHLRRRTGIIDTPRVPHIQGCASHAYTLPAMLHPMYTTSICL